MHLDDDQAGARAAAAERLGQMDDRLGADRLDPDWPESLPQGRRKAIGFPCAADQPQRTTLSPFTPNAPILCRRTAPKWVVRHRSQLFAATAARRRAGRWDGRAPPDPDEGPGRRLSDRTGGRA
ncbi:hypothetical protein GCM10010187_48050 [Actinomadura coerulea]|nr:hypothetical protein GCM10010187_48050 [Actinomadura coerulea]